MPQPGSSELSAKKTGDNPLCADGKWAMWAEAVECDQPRHCRRQQGSRILVASDNFFFFFLEARDLERALEAAVTFRAIKQQ